MVSWFLLLCVCVMVVILLAVNFYVLVHYSHPDDKNEAYLPKVLVIFGLLLAESCMLALPLDVANQSTNVGCAQGWLSTCGGLDMYLFWEIMYVMTTVMCVAILPFAIFYYEDNDGLSKRSTGPIATAVKYTLACLFASGIILGLCYFFAGKISVPVWSYPATIEQMTYHSNVTYSVILSTAETTVGSTIGTGRHLDHMRFASSFIVYMIALVSFVGWFLFCVFGGVGLAALPTELISTFTNRPKPMSDEDLAHTQLLMQSRTADLLEVGRLMQQERKDRRFKGGGGYLSRIRAERSDRTTLNKFKQMVFLLEEDYEKLCAAKDLAKLNPLYPYIMLALGVISAFITALWVIHVVVSMFFDPPLDQFLNKYFIQFDGWFPLFGVMSVAIFTLYLLFTVVAGNFKLGVRVLWVSLHPMKINGTYMNSFLFNLILILLCTFPIVQFSAEAFAGYARFSNIYQFFGVQIKYLVFFNYFFANNVFVYLLLSFTFASTAWFMVCPRDRPHQPDSVKVDLRRRLGRRDSK